MRCRVIETRVVVVGKVRALDNANRLAQGGC